MRHSPPPSKKPFRLCVTILRLKCTAAQWSPDGQWIAFLSSRGGEKASLWQIRIDGGEAERLTEEKGGISGFKYSPDGSKIAFTMTDPPS